MSTRMPGLPPPALTPITAPYWRAAGEGRLRLQCCGDCGAVRHPPTAACYSCQSPAIDWVDHPGTGTVHSFIWTHRPVTPAFAHLGVFNVTVVELDDTAGPEPVRILSRVEGVDKASLTIGMAVRVDFDPIEAAPSDDDGEPVPAIALPVFLPA